MAKYEFFFSYKRDNWDPFMESFFNDLAKEIARKTPRSEKEEFAFQDQGEIKLGQDWRPRLLDGLQNSAVLVPLYTPGYFKSEWCGREFEYFRQRQNQPAAAGFPYPCVIPVLWDIQESDIPKDVGVITFKDKSLPDEYADEGMLLLTKLKASKYKDAYVLALDAIATAIVRAARQNLPALANPPAALQLDTVPSAFHPKPPPMAPPVPIAQPQPVAALPPGPGSAHFYYLAASKAELQQAQKGAIDYYHPNGGKFWRPTLDGKRLDALVADVAGSKDLDLAFQDVPLDASLADRLKEARDNNNMVVFFTDAWTVELLPRYRQFAIDYDQHAYFNSSLLVVWNEGDPDLTEARKAELRATLEKVLKTASTRQEPYFVPQIVGEMALQDRLRQSLEKLFHKIAEQGTPAQPFEAMAKPVLPVHSGG